MVTRAVWRAYRQEFYDDLNFETVSSQAALQFKDDFLGGGYTAAFPAAGSPVAGFPWVTKIVGAAPPTAALVANAAGGQAAFTLTSASQAQEASIYFNDNLSIDLTKRAHAEYVATLSVPPSATNTSAFWGLTQAWASGGALASARYIGFGANASNGLVLYLGDGVQTLAVAAALMATPATAITLDTNAHVFGIDMTNPADVVFTFDGNRCNAVNSFAWGATAAHSITQPYMGVVKSSGTGVGTLTVDKVSVYANRV